jgi:hypothetical protein
MRRPIVLSRSQVRFCIWEIFFFIACTASTFGQPFEWQPRPSFQVLHGSQPLLNPFTGGINAPIIQFVDIDGDGDLDLFLLDIDGRLNYYENVGTKTTAQFLLRTMNFQIVNVGSWYRFVDIDGDGDYDLFCNGPSATVNFYRNTGSKTNPILTLETVSVKDVNNNPMISEQISVPTFADLDGDGDLDFFSGNSVGTIYYYENVGTAQSFQFRFITDKFQGIQIIGLKNARQDESLLPMLKQARHGAMAIDLADIDKDNDLDLYWGDLFNKSLYFIENRGSRSVPNLVLRDSTFPKPNIIQTNGFNMPQWVDINGDGLQDLFIACLFGATLDNFHLYRNTGTGFQRDSLNYIPTIDVGAASSPVFVDIDGDGDKDLFIGSEDGKLAFYERVGSGANAQYILRTNSYINLGGLFNISPAFGDIDGDGKLDLIVGEALGKLHLYRGSNLAAEDTTFALRSVSFGQNASPTLVDFENRGILDLFVGTGGGRIAYYKNTGSKNIPQFTLQTTTFQSINVHDDAKPLFVDLDGKGTLDLVLGSRDSSITFWRNTGGTFTKVANFFSDIPLFVRTAPAFEDIDGDGDLDLFLGNYKGGLSFHKNQRVVLSVEPASQPVQFQLGQNYPNPFNPETSLEFWVSSSELVRLTIYDVLGREVAVLVNEGKKPGAYRVRWDGHGFPSGLYYYRLQAGGFVETKKMILLK